MVEVQYEEMVKHDTKGDCWMAIHGKVYDVTNFLDEHPGGAEVMMEMAGTDATDAFDDIGHSNGAKKQLVEKCECKGELVGAPEKKKRGSSGGGGGGEGGVGIAGILVPVVVMAVLAFLVQKFV